MRDLYGDDYASVAVGGETALIPGGVRRIAGAAVFLALVAGLGLWSWRLGTRDAAEVPIIRAMEGPSRVEPADPGGIRAAHQGLEVNDVLAGKPAQVAPAAKVAAAEESLAAEDGPQGELVLAAPETMAERMVAESGELHVPGAEAADEIAALGGPLADPALPADADLDALDPATPAVTGPRPMNRPANLVVVRAKPAAAQAVPSAQPAVAKAPAPAAKAAPAKEVAGLQKGTRLVQLGAFDSEAITRKAWDQLVARNPDLLASKSLYIERTTANARVFYRLRVAGFTNTDQTREMCEALRGRGIDCIPVTLQ
jgi:SPOR domain